MAHHNDDDTPPSSPGAENEDVLMDEEEEQQGEEMAEGSEADLSVSPDKVEIIASSRNDQTAMTFCFKDEDHTLGNALRHMINKNPEVDFCGYSIPHPSEAKMHMRIQTTNKTTATEALRKGLDDLYDLCAYVQEAYEAALLRKDYPILDTSE